MKSLISGKFAFNSNKLVLSAMVVSTLVLSGCASVSAPDRSNTMSSFEQLSLQPDGTRTWRTSNAAKPSAVRLEPKEIAFTSSVIIDDEQKAVLKQAIMDELSKQFNEAGVRVGNANDPEAVAIRVNITEVSLANPTVNVITTLLLFAPVSRGSMSIEMEALSVKDNKRFAALAFSGKAGVNNVLSAFSGVGHAKLQAELAATKFVELVAGVSKTK
jgi:outer membrane murein-binding lipoprotein Lpp